MFDSLSISYVLTLTEECPNLSTATVDDNNANNSKLVDLAAAAAAALIILVTMIKIYQMLAMCRFAKPIIYCCVSNHIKFNSKYYLLRFRGVGFCFMWYWLGRWVALTCLAFVAPLQLGTH